MNSLAFEIAAAVPKSRRNASILLAVLIFSICATACTNQPQIQPLSDPGENLILQHVTIVDTHDGHLLPDMTVSIKAGVITSIDQNENPPHADNTPIVDARGKFLVAGFVDAHVHVLASPRAADDEALMLANGITAFRQMNGTPELLQRRSEGRLFQSIFAPRALAIPGPVLLPTNAFSPADAVAEVDHQKSQGADFIKVGLVPPATFYAIGAEAKKVGLPYEGHLPPGVDAIDAANAGYRSVEHLGPGSTILIGCSTDEDALKTQIAAHPQKKPPPLPDFLVNWFVLKLTRDPLLAEIFFDPGTMSRMQRVVETFDESKCRSLAAAIAKTGKWQVPTLIRLRTSEFPDSPEFRDDPNLKYVPEQDRKDWQDVSRKFAKTFTPEQRATIEKFWELQLRLARIFDDAGVPMLTGTDSSSGTAAGFNLHQEFALFAQAGFTPLKILQMATLNPAQFFNRETTMGSVAVGKYADLVLLDANPIENAQNLNRINAVVRAGSYYSRATLDAKLRELAH